MLDLIMVISGKHEQVKFEAPRRLTRCHDSQIQSTLVISKSKGLYETLRDIRTST